MKIAPDSLPTDTKQTAMMKIQAEDNKKMEELHAALPTGEVDLGAFKNLSIKEKVAITNEAINSQDNEETKEGLRKAAYYALNKEILNHNLAPNNKGNSLEFISDKKHQPKIHELKEIIDFVHKNVLSSQEQTKSSGIMKGIASETKNLVTNMATELNNFRKDPLHHPVLKNLDKSVSDSLNRARQYLKSDPTERSMTNRGKQLAGATLNVTVWFAKQCVNVIRKPIALTANVGKATYNTVALATDALSGKDTQSRKAELWQNVKDAGRDLRESAVAGVTVFAAVAMAPIGAIPAAAAVLATGVGAVGVATAITATAHAGALMMTAPGIAAQVGENALKAAYLKAEYNRTGPELYSEQEKGALGNLHKLMSTSTDPILKQQALETMNKLEEHLKAEQMKQDKTGKRLHSINSFSGKAARLMNKMMGTCLNETGSGITAPTSARSAQTNQHDQGRTSV